MASYGDLRTRNPELWNLQLELVVIVIHWNTLLLKIKLVFLQYTTNSHTNIIQLKDRGEGLHRLIMRLSTLKSRFSLTAISYREALCERWSWKVQ